MLLNIAEFITYQHIHFQGGHVNAAHAVHQSLLAALVVLDPAVQVVFARGDGFKDCDLLIRFGLVAPVLMAVQVN